MLLLARVHNYGLLLLASSREVATAWAYLTCTYLAYNIVNCKFINFEKSQVCNFNLLTLTHFT